MSTFARPRSGALLEREHELERVVDVLGAGARYDGGALVIEGAAGMGKSRLLDEVCRTATELDLNVFRARATELEQGFPFGVVRQLFERPLLEAESAQRERWLAGAAARATEVLRPLSDASSRAPPGEPPDPDTTYARQHGLYWLASNIAADTPLAIVVDDLQWCDPGSAGALAFIAHRLDEQALTMILATRPLDPALMPEAATLVGDLSAELLRPAPLTQAAVTQLIALHLSAEPDDRFARACLDVTGGNPCLLGELLTEAATSVLEPTAAAAADIAATVPRGVANTVLLRLARMAPEAATLARALSVLRDGGQMSDAARLAGLARTGLDEAMAALVSAEVVESAGTVRFTHPILRPAIYDDLS